MTSIFPETFAPPMIATNGRFGVFDRVAQEVELLLHEVAGRALLERDAGHRAVGPVGGAEGVVHEHVAEPGERGAEGLHGLGVGLDRRPVLLLHLPFLLDVEAEILEEGDLARREGRAGTLDLGSDAVGLEPHRLSEELRELLRHRLERVLRDLLPVRSAQVAHEHQARALAEHVLDGGQRGAQALVVLHLAVLHRHVEVHAHDHALALEVEVLDEELGHGRRPFSCRSREKGRPLLGPPPGNPGDVPPGTAQSYFAPSFFAM